MRISVLLPALALAVSACATTPASSPMPMLVDIDTTAPGTYYYVDDAGNEGRFVARADGSYVEYLGAEQVATGTWNLENGNKCFDPSDELAAAVCYADGARQVDGSWLSTGCDGLTYTMRYEAL
ncbi:hypothetical protein WJT74_11010 [Sphingomicrobium sp. XHP0239]|uniref:hypothetical protein n=1 Tax=Sphingomicrobium maritimum TaxID=3133972 RepID=UPI0031CC7598